jgi:hypothetical protein
LYIPKGNTDLIDFLCGAGCLDENSLFFFGDIKAVEKPIIEIDQDL